MDLTPLEIESKKFKQLLRQKQIFSLKDKEQVWYFLKGKGQTVLTKPSHHRLVWLKCSGAWNLMLSNPGY
jgi:hypothetical protein